MTAFRAEVAALRAQSETYLAYRPGTRHACTSQEWQLCGDEIRLWVGRSKPAAPSTAQMWMARVTSYVVWCLRNDVPLAAEVMLTPERVEAYIKTLTASSERSRAVVAGTLRSVGLANTRKAAWQRPATTYHGTSLAGPYSADEIAGYWNACLAQSTTHRRHPMATILSLGLGAGLRRAELYQLRTSHIIHHPTHDDLMVVVLPDRLVPLRHEVRDTVLNLCDEQPTGRLIGDRGTGTSLFDPLGHLRDALDIPASLPASKLARLRTTWAVACLSDGVNLAEFIRMAGTSSSRLLALLPGFIATRDARDDWMLPASGLAAATTPMPGLPMNGGSAR